MSLIAGAAAIACVLYWGRLEEAKLVELYGEEYREYKKRTWF
jgi:protein-S-isoprenylcysteine O-methyltransferase Ste14